MSQFNGRQTDKITETASCRATINVEFERQSGWDFAGGGRNGVRA